MGSHLTGYGQQTSVWVPRMKAVGHEIAVSSTNGLQYATMEWQGVRCYPADHTGLNKRMLRHQIVEEYGSADGVQVISLWDVWPWVDPQYGGMVADFDGLDIAAWVPVDCLPVNIKTRAALDRFDVRPIAMSRFGETQLREAGYDPLYVPHGVETGVFVPHDDRDDCKRSLGIDPDRFVVGMVAFNQGVQPPRKAFPQVLQAFSEFRRRHDDVMLYLHTEVSGIFEGVNLLMMSEVFGIPQDSVAAVPQVPYLAGAISKWRMSRIYSAMDVLANPSYGEGFGLPIVEAQACGTPVVVSEFSSMPELCGAGWTVGGQPWYNPSSGAMWLDPSAQEILAAFEAAYEARGDLELRARAREFALQYDADRVMEEHWKPVLAALDGPREVPPLKPPAGLNREQRRRAAKAAA